MDGVEGARDGYGLLPIAVVFSAAMSKRFERPHEDLNVSSPERIVLSDCAVQSIIEPQPGAPRAMIPSLHVRSSSPATAQSEAPTAPLPGFRSSQFAKNHQLQPFQQRHAPISPLRYPVGTIAALAALGVTGEALKHS